MLARQHDSGSKVLLTYLNRLSDLLFVLAWALEVRSVVSKVIEELIYRNSGEK